MDAKRSNLFALSGPAAARNAELHPNIFYLKILRERYCESIAVTIEFKDEGFLRRCRYSRRDRGVLTASTGNRPRSRLW
jgi:hypothetical protein